MDKKIVQELLLGVLLCYSFISLLKAAENMQNSSIFREKDLLILVYFTLSFECVDMMDLHFVLVNKVHLSSVFCPF